MAPQFGRLTSQLVEAVIPPTDICCEQINRRISPRVAVTPESIHVGAMYLVSDQVNSFGGRFPADEHGRLAELIVDSPVLVGHRKDSLPIARNFHAELVERSGEKWVKCYFYWLRGSQGAESLKTNIEGGLYKECSIAFTYNLPECSVCGADIRACEHEPGLTYQSDGGEAVCHFNYRQIERVLEASLVYRGAVPNTLVTTSDMPARIKSAPDLLLLPHSNGPSLQSIDSLDSLDPEERYLVVPRYDAIPVVLSLQNNQVAITRFDQSPIPLAHNLTPPDNQLARNRVGLLIGLHGRRRCSRQEIENRLNNQSSPASRLVVAVYPDTTVGARPHKHPNTHSSIRILPHRLVPASDLAAAVRAVATRDGVEIWPLSANPLIDSGYHYRGGNSAERPAALSPVLAHDPVSRTVFLSLTDGGRLIRFSIPKFTPAGFSAGRRFLVDPIEGDQAQNTRLRRLPALSTFDCKSSLEGPEESLTRITLCRVVLNGRRRFLIYKSSETSARRGYHALN